MELTTAQAGVIVGMSNQAIRDHISAGRLAARQHGIRRLWKIHVDELRRFATAYNYSFDEGYLSRLANKEQVN